RLDHDAPQPLQRDLNRVAWQVDALVHARRHAHAPHEGVRVDRFVVIARGDEQPHDEPGLVVAPNDRQVFGSAHLHRDRAQRIDNRRPQRHERQGRRQLRAKNLFLALCASHFGWMERTYVTRRAAYTGGTRRLRAQGLRLASSWSRDNYRNTREWG